MSREPDRHPQEQPPRRVIEPLTIRPRSGTRSLRKRACLRVEDGAIVATNRRGRIRTFPLADAENSPTSFGSALADGRVLFWLQDRTGRSVLLLDLGDWDDSEFAKFERATGLRGSGTQPPPKRPDVFRVMDPAYLNWGIRAAAVGGAAISLRWLDAAPELVVLWVALPCLVFAVWCLFMHQRSSPSHEQVLEELRELDEDLIAAGEEPIGPVELSPRRKKRTRRRR